MTQVKLKDLKWEQEALVKRLEFVKSLRTALQNNDSLVAQTVDVYSGIIDDIINDVCLEVHRAVKTGAEDVSALKNRNQSTAERDENTTTQQPSFNPPPAPTAHTASSAAAKGNVDMFGNQIQPIALDQVACPSCGRTVAAGRFAPHLDKCMGRGRQASRNAHRRLSELDDDFS